MEGLSNTGGNIQYGDLCFIRDTSSSDIANEHLAEDRFVTSPLTCFIDSQVGLQARGDIVNFQTCVFQILSKENSQSFAAFKSAVISTRQRIERRKAQAHHEERKRRLQKHGAGESTGTAPSRFQSLNRRAVALSNLTDVPTLGKCIDELLSGSQTQRAERLMDDAVRELQQNDIEHKTQFGQSMRYGDIIHLWQPYSKSFLSVSQSATSATDHGISRMEMSPSSSVESQFIVRPRYKIRATGDVVQNEDEILLESMIASGQYAHSSSRDLVYPDETSLRRSAEMVCSPFGGSFSVSVYSRPQEHVTRQPYSIMEAYIWNMAKRKQSFSKVSDDQHIPIMSGSMIQLNHPNSETFLSAEGSTAPTAPDEINGIQRAPVTMQPHGRVRRRDSAIHVNYARPSTATTFFEFENIDITIGGAVELGTPIRIKHVATQLYLCQGSELFTTPGATNTETVLPVQLRPLPTSDANDLRSFGFRLTLADAREHDNTAWPRTGLRIEHVNSGLWLTVSSTDEITRGELESSKNGGCHRSHNPFSTRSHAWNEESRFLDDISKLEFDKSTLLRVYLTSKVEFHNSFTVYHVEDKLKHYTNYVAGFMPLIRRYFSLRRLRELETPEVNTITAQLAELRDFMSPLGLPDLERQRVLRGLQTLDALIIMLRSPFYLGYAYPKCSDLVRPMEALKTPEPDHLLVDYDSVSLKKFESTAKVMIHVCAVVRAYLDGMSKKNELYAVEHIPLLWSMFGSNVPVGPLINELVSDNPEVIRCIHHKEVERVIKFFQQAGHRRNPSFLKFLSNICVQEGTKPNRTTQNSVCDALLGLSDSHQSNLVLYEIVENTEEDLRVQCRATNESTSLSAFVFTALDEQTSTLSSEQAFLYHQLELLGMLCLGRNQRCIARVRHLLPWSVCVSCATAESASEEFVKHWFSKMWQDRSLSDTLNSEGVFRLPRRLKRIFFFLIEVLYVDTAPHIDNIGKLDYNVNISDLVHDERERQSLNGAASNSTQNVVDMGEIVEWLKHYFTQNLYANGVYLVQSHSLLGRPQNDLLLAILELMHSFVRHGIFSCDDDLKFVCTVTHEILDSDSDFLHDKMAKLKKHLDLSSSAQVYQIRRQSSSRESAHQREEIEIRQQMERSATMLQYQKWKTSPDRHTPNADYRALVLVKKAALKCALTLYDLSFNVQFRNMLLDIHIFGTARKYRSALSGTRHSRRQWQFVNSVVNILPLCNESQRERLDHLSFVLGASSESFSSDDDSRKHATKYFALLGDICPWRPLDWGIGVSDQIHASTVNSTSVNSGFKHLKVLDILGRLCEYDSAWLATNAPKLLTRIFSHVSRLADHVKQTKLFAPVASAQSSTESAEKHTIAGSRSSIIFASPNRLATHSREMSARLRQFVIRRVDIGFNAPSLFQRYAEAIIDFYRNNSSAETDLILQHQHVLNNSGIVDATLDLVKLSTMDPEVLQRADIDVCATVSSALYLLRMCSIDFPDVQTKLHASLVWMLDLDMRSLTIPDHKEGEYHTHDPLHEFGLLLQSVFTNCKQNIMNLEEIHVTKLVAQFQSDQPDRHRRVEARAMLGVLRIVCRDELRGVVVSKNQQMVMQLLLRHKRELIIDFLYDNSGIPFQPILKTPMSEQCDELEYHLNLLDLLVDLCEEAPYMQDICRSLLPVKVIQLVLANSHVSLLRKASYLKFLSVVFLGYVGLPDTSSDINISSEMLDPLLESFSVLSDQLTEQLKIAPSQDLLVFTVDAYAPCLASLHFRVTSDPASKTDVDLTAKRHKLVVSAAAVLFHVLETNKDELNDIRQLDPSPVLVLSEAAVQKPMKLSDLKMEKILHQLRGWVSRWITNAAPARKSSLLGQKCGQAVMALYQAYQGRDTVVDQLSVVMPLLEHRFKVAISKLKTARFSDFAEPLPLGQEFITHVVFALMKHAFKANQSQVQSFYSHFLRTVGIRSAADNQNLETHKPLQDQFLLGLTKLLYLHPGSRIDLGESDRAEHDKVVVQTLRSVRGIFHLYNTLKVKDSTIDDSSVQRQMCEVIPAICCLLVDTEPLLIRIEGAMLLKSIIDDGFSEAQQAFAQHFLRKAGDWKGREFIASVAQILSFYKDVLEERRKQNYLRGLRKVRAIKSQRKLFRKLSLDSRQHGEIPDSSMYIEPKQSRVVPVHQIPDDKTTFSSTVEVVTDAPKSARVILTLLQSLCEGHHAFFQNLMRTETTVATSGVNTLIGMTSELLLSAADNVEVLDSIESGSLEMLHHAIQDLLVVCHAVEALTEYAQGNLINTRVILDSVRVPEAIWRLLGRKCYPDFPKDSGKREWCDVQVRLDGSLITFARTLLDNSGGRFNSNFLSKLGYFSSQRMNHYYTMFLVSCKADIQDELWNIRSDDRGDSVHIGPFQMAHLLFTLLLQVSEAQDQSAERYSSGAQFKKFVKNHYNNPVQFGAKSFLVCTSSIMKQRKNLELFIKKPDKLPFPLVEASLARDCRIQPLFEVAQGKRDKSLPFPWQEAQYQIADGHVSTPSLTYQNSESRSRGTKPKFDDAQSEALEISTDDSDTPMSKLNSETRSVELKHGETLTRVYFPREQKWIEALPQQTKHDLMYKIDRSTHAKSLEDLTSRMKTIIADMMHRRHVMEKGGFIVKIILRKERWWRNLVLLDTYLLNVVILISWQAPQTDFFTRFPVVSSPWLSIFTIFAVVHIILSTLVFIAYFLSHTFVFPDFVRITGISAAGSYLWQLREATGHYRKAISTTGGIVGDSVDDVVTVQESQNLLTSIDAEQATIQAIRNNKGLIKKSDRTQISLLEPMPIYHVVFLVLSVLGLAFHGACYSFHLLHVVVGNETMQRTLRSVTKNGVTLLYVAYILLTIIYMYSLFVFSEYRMFVDRQDGAWCESVIQCFLSSVRIGLISGGGLGEGIAEAGYSYEEAIQRTFFDLSFFVLITTIGLNVVFGVIVDTFTELRDEKYQIEKEKRTKCLICGLSSEEFERSGTTFQRHTKVDHNVWNYLHYCIYLHHRDPNEYNALEQSVAIDWFSADGHYEFFPRGMALQFPAPLHVPISIEDSLEQKLESHNQRLLSKINNMLISTVGISGAGSASSISGRLNRLDEQFDKLTQSMMDELQGLKFKIDVLEQTIQNRSESNV